MCVCVEWCLAKYLTVHVDVRNVQEWCVCWSVASMICSLQQYQVFSGLVYRSEFFQKPKLFSSNATHEARP